VKGILAAWAVLVVSAAASACQPAPGGARPRAAVRVAAAADLNAALDDLAGRFSASHPVDVVVSYGSSGTFYAQLLNHAPFDLFFSADVEYPRQLAARGLTSPGSDFDYAVGRIVVWVPAASAIEFGADALRAVAGPAVKHIAIANPEHAPYGRAAVAALQHAGVYDDVHAKLVFGENVAQALQFAETGAADAGIVALSLALAPAAKGRGRWAEIPLDAYPRIEQGGVILKWAADLPAARSFREFVLSADGRAILARYGFVLPER
jgi:molybdate transport system substrate-binding protein